MLALLYLKFSINPEHFRTAAHKNEIELFVMRWMDLESVIQSEISQKEKNTTC